MRPPCPWREAEEAELRPEAPGRLDREDVGFVSPGHSPGCEQEEAAAYPGRPHPGEWPGRAAGPVTLVHLRSARGGHRGGARLAERLGPGPVPLRSRSVAALPLLTGKINRPGRGCSAGAGARGLRFPSGRAPPHAGLGAMCVRAPGRSSMAFLKARTPLRAFEAAVLEVTGCSEVACARRQG